MQMNNIAFHRHVFFAFVTLTLTLTYDLDIRTSPTHSEDPSAFRK